MSKSVALLLVLVFLAASSLVAFKPVSSANVPSGYWVSKAPMQVARSFVGVAVVNGKIYAIGGSADDGVVGTNEEYDPATDTWTFKTSMPTPRKKFAIVSCQDKIYCIGGSTDVQSQSITAITEVYDPATDSWETKASLPNLRSGIKAHEVNGKIYIIGGVISDNSTADFSLLSLNDVYDPEADSWSSRTPMPTAMPGTLSAVVGEKIYFVMGLSDPHQIYDVENDRWSLAGTPLPAFSALHVTACATAGVDAPERIYIVADTGTLVYDPINDEWTSGTTILKYREGFSVAVVNDVLCAIGGFTGTNDMFWNIDITRYATNEQYTPFGYGTVPPEITVVSPKNEACTSADVTLDFTVNKQASWLGYSLDGEGNVTVTGNVTLSGLPDGLHNVTVYARDEFGNLGVSETSSFTVDESFPVVPVAVASAASICVVGVGLLVYFKKRKH